MQPLSTLVYTTYHPVMQPLSTLAYTTYHLSFAGASSSGALSSTLLSLTAGADTNTVFSS